MLVHAWQGLITLFLDLLQLTYDLLRRLLAAHDNEALAGRCDLPDHGARRKDGK
jgi:hypothetical protein